MHIEHRTRFWLSAVSALLAIALLVGCNQEEASGGGTVVIVEPGDDLSGQGGGPSGAGGAGGVGENDAAGGAGGAGGVGENDSAGGSGGADESGQGGAGGEAGGGADNGGGGAEPTAGCDTNDFVPVRESFEEDDTGIVRYAAFGSEPSNARPVADVWLLELHPNRGFPMVPGTYDLAELGSDFNTCQICVVNFRDFNFQTGARTMNLVANEGLVEITALGDVNEPFQATLRGVKFKEASITRGPTQDLVIDYVPNGTTACADGYEIDVVRKPRPALVGESVYDFQLQNCETEEFVSVGELAARTNAVWFIGTAGWCGACRNLLQNGDAGRGVGRPLDVAEELGPEQLELMIVIGENPNRGPADLRYCRQYASSYAEDASNFYLDHDGTAPFRTLFSYLNVYTSANGMFGLPWNAVVSGGIEPMMYRYADRSGQRESLGQIIDSLTSE
ncbi:MAG: hypothetical protein ACON3Z_19790 [Bradymonadia bacterium]